MSSSSQNWKATLGEVGTVHLCCPPCTLHAHFHGPWLVQGLCTSHLCGPWLVRHGCLGHLAPPTSATSLSCSYLCPPGLADSHGSDLSGAPLNPLKNILGQSAKLALRRLSLGSWACSSHTPAPLGHIAWAFEQLPNHKTSINVFSGKG